jgi:hypothetical protein
MPIRFAITSFMLNEYALFGRVFLQVDGERKYWSSEASERPRLRVFSRESV